MWIFDRLALVRVRCTGRRLPFLCLQGSLHHESDGREYHTKSKTETHKCEIDAHLNAPQSIGFGPAVASTCVLARILGI